MKCTIWRTSVLTLLAAALGCGDISDSADLPAGAADTVSGPSQPGCEIPWAPTVPAAGPGTTLVFHAADDAPIQVGLADDPGASEPDEWRAGPSLQLPAEPGQVVVFARIPDQQACVAAQFLAVYTISDVFPPAANEDGTTAVHKADGALVAWATGWVDPVVYGPNVGPLWQTPERALGPALGGSADVVSLGDGGSIVLTFESGIGDGDGPDFAVFENGFGHSFLELAFIEVSSDGATFVRFDSVYARDEPVTQYGQQEATAIAALAGKYGAGYGVPYDLALLRFRPEAASGALDLNHVTHVRVVDIVGDGSTVDSFGHPIYDPHPTVDTGGFDLEAIGVLHPAGAH